MKRVRLLADNFYWIARDDESYRGLNSLAPASIDAQALSGPTVSSSSGEEGTWNVRLKNTGASPALAMKLTLFHADNTRVLPAYYSVTTYPFCQEKSARLSFMYRPPPPEWVTFISPCVDGTFRKGACRRSLDRAPSRDSEQIGFLGFVSGCSPMD